MKKPGIVPKPKFIDKYKDRILHKCRLCKKMRMCLKDPENKSWYCLECWEALHMEI